MNAHLRLPVVERSQTSAARAAARELAEGAGFEEADSYRAGLVVTELATNLVKHAHDGELLIRVTSSTSELEVISVDRGPGIADLSVSLADGHSTSGSPGTGLGAIRRLSDTFDIYTQPGRGTAVVARLRARHASRIPHRVQVEGVSVPKLGEAVCGDAWHVRHDPHGTIILLADGLGHGQLAADAAHTAVGAFARSYQVGPSETLQTLHELLRPTRGAAAAIAEIRSEERVVRFAGIGNIAGQIVQNGTSRQTVSFNGTLGHVARTFREYAYPWAERALLVLASDGLGTHWTLDDYPGIQPRDPALVATVLYRDHSRKRDDVTVVVAREAA